MDVQARVQVVLMVTVTGSITTRIATLTTEIAVYGKQTAPFATTMNVHVMKLV